jgi:TonB family protein
MNRHNVRRIDALTGELIRRAARHAPPSLSQRLEEEWLADMATRHGELTRLRLAVGCWWAARVIAHEHALTSLAPAGSSGGHQIAAAYTPRDSSFLSRRTIALLLIASLHAGLIYFLAIGLVHKVVEAPPPVIHAHVAPGAQTALRPPPLKFHLREVEVPVPPPVIPWNPPADSDAIRGNTVDETNEVTSTPLHPRSPERVIGGPDRGFPNTEDYYPDASRRLGERGVAAVQVCIDGSGRLTASPSIAQSSGSERLDAGALKLAKAGSGHYRATTEDGRAVPSCFAFRIRFDFRD